MTEGADQIDYDKLAAAVAAKQTPAQPAQQQAGGSIYQQTLQKHLANPENNRDSVVAIHELIEAKAHELVDTNAKAANLDRATQFLAREIGAVVEADEDLAKFGKAVELLVGSEFKGDSTESASRLEKLVKGELTQEDMKKLVRKHFNELAGAESKQSTGALTGMKTEINGQNAANQKAGAVPKSDKDLNEAQREVYYSIKAEYERVGLKQLGMTTEQVETEALTRASRKFKEGRII